MGTLEQIMQMKKQGLQEADIINSLQAQGTSPKEIQDALNQAQIKQTVSGENTMQEQTPIPNQGQETDSQQMQPSITEQTSQTQEQAPIPNQGQEIQQTPPYPQNYGAQQTPQEPYAQQQTYYPQTTEYSPNMQQNYGNQEYYSTQDYSNTDTTMEIAEQVVQEKTQKIEKAISKLNEFKTLTETKIETLDKRLKKIESVIDKIEIEILKKVGSYGDGIEGIKKELSMMQDSFGKVINPLTDKKTKHKNPKKRSKR
jgi:hypothetical protein